MPTRGTPRVQFPDIRKMELCQGLPHCLRICVDPCMAHAARHAQSLNSSLQTGEKGQNVISFSVQHPISLIFAIHVSFILGFGPMS